MQLFVRTPSSSSSSKQISVTVNANDSVELLKGSVSDIGGFPFELLRLTFCSKLLDDSRRVGDYGIAKGDTLQAHLALQGRYRPGPESCGVPVDFTVRVINTSSLTVAIRRNGGKRRNEFGPRR
ncbi:unnamed protein product [Polarella glacialis]|uniref:Ubiquitin-like domain-containing protein n=1 Tax=Polarella glacialis TaxID=89957 RepID=A0A813DM33_POLGL|nr:unnamed protein product [Polarella glacialis]